MPKDNAYPFPFGTRCFWGHTSRDHIAMECPTRTEEDDLLGTLYRHGEDCKPFTHCKVCGVPLN